MNKGIRNFILYPAIIAIAYWLTDATIYTGIIESIKAWITIKSIGLLLIPLAVLFTIAKKEKLEPREIRIIGFCSPVWIWVFSSFYMPIVMALRGEGSFSEIGAFLLVFPIMAIEISTWSGGLLGLVLASIGIPITAIIIAKKTGSSNNRRGENRDTSHFTQLK